MGLLRTALLATASLLALPALRAADALAFQWRWVYVTANFQVNESVDKLLAVMQRARAAGYNGVVLADFKFGRFEGRPAHYYTNLERARQTAADLGLDLVPCVMPIGYSTALLMNNPDLAAALPVRDAPFVVAGGQATVADRANLLPGGAFERFTKGPPDGWDFVDGPGKSTFADAQVKHGGQTALRMESFRAGNDHGNCRVTRKLTLAPWRQYHVSLWLKSQGVKPADEVRVQVLDAAGRPLTYTGLRLAATQDWQQHHIVFNTLANAQVTFYIGIWGGREGTLWVDDASLTACGGVNLLRRDGCPVRVTSADGATVYEEGRDFARWEYAKMGRDPYPGSFQVYHPEPPLKLLPGTQVRDGDRLLVSYYHTTIIHDSQVACCLTHPEVYTHLERQVRNVQQYFRPKYWFMSHDEIRVAGWCELCTAAGKTTGELLAANVRRCSELIQQVAPAAEVLVWSDMFDPHHNARDHYYLVRDTLAKSWEGLDRRVILANWNGGKKAESLRFFAERGHRQVLAGYYDTGDLRAHTQAWLDAAAGVASVGGIMYTTWRANYADLEAFAEFLRFPRP